MSSRKAMDVSNGVGVKNGVTNGSLPDKEVTRDNRPKKVDKTEDRKRLMTAVHVSNVLYYTCLTMNKGALPYLAKRFEISNTLWGHIITTTALLQFVGGPLFGRFGDVYGGRLSLTLSCVAMATWAAMLSVSTSFQGVLLSTVPLVFSHVPTAHQMVISDVTDDASRSVELGALRVSMPVGSMIGSALGGILTETYGTTTTFLFTAMLSCVSAVLAWTYIPVQTKQRRDKRLSPKKREIVNFREIARLLKIPAVAHLLGMKFAFIFANMIILNSYPIIVRDTFGMGPQEAGIFAMYNSMVAVVFQMVAIRPLTRRYKDFHLMLLSSLVLTSSYVIAAAMTERWHLYLFAVSRSFGVNLRNTVIMAALSKASPREDTGAVMGLGAMVVSLTQVVSPPISAYILDHVGYPFLGVTSATITVMVAVFILMTKDEFR
ncbi:solute carrier family 22 member 18-like [Branchiostoma floridae]|uniref:Solute carrier family 22 member 18-like n=1 Tax=Branchiostoma floridae TaxID=7739 RepID=A0A9J7K722_BRAFL|nr:solute carrier family 22 member 18-like [Branchiostoma floridae]